MNDVAVVRMRAVRVVALINRRADILPRGNASGSSRIGLRMLVLSRLERHLRVLNAFTVHRICESGLRLYQPLYLYIASSGNGIDCQQHRRWCSWRSICMSPCFRVSQRKGICFVPECINACVQAWRVLRFCCSGHRWLFSTA